MGFVFSITKKNSDISLSFQVKTADPHLSDENQASKTYEAKAYSSLSQSYLYIDWASNHKVLQVGDLININVHPHSPYIHKIHHYSYLVSDRCFLGNSSHHRICTAQATAPLLYNLSVLQKKLVNSLTFQLGIKSPLF